ncbi:multiple coagulation factor deficiency protein 2 homolog [Drosophila serrata]|uniref:multiple coagulation factor deficiency protein 2 homolog n=1 Tax=Drosophila serrata TaxID=7274 RepID=UPI000A1D358D|nr:multiple coagulation factor deficiency protein 2 homolog [Drosophila serrata]
MMMFILDNMLFLLILLGLAVGQRLPPGINPKRYQMPEHIHPSHPQEYSYNYFQSSEVKETQHNHQQPQVERAPKKILTKGNMELERSHIQEHMSVPLDTIHMSEAELQFHYFKMHDSDDNDKLDGCELFKAMIHLHDEQIKNKKEIDTFTDEEVAALIDPIMEMDDTSQDGYIDYPEFIKARDKKRD